MWQTPAFEHWFRQLDGGVVATAQLSPVHPGMHAQRPCTQTPCMLHASGHVGGTLQSAPDQPGSQKHLPYLHAPCCEHAFGHDGATSCEQSAPVRPGAQKHFSRTQTPWPEQSFGQAPRASEQSRPVKPGTQKHVPSMHAPCCEHASRHAGVALVTAEGGGALVADSGIATAKVTTTAVAMRDPRMR